MTTLVRLQPGQPGQGLDYNPRLPLPYPIFVDIDDHRCENAPGGPLIRSGCPRSDLPELIGHQASPEPADGTFVTVDEFLDGPLEDVVGRYLVLAYPNGEWSSLAVPITDATALEVASHG